MQNLLHYEETLTFILTTNKQNIQITRQEESYLNTIFSQSFYKPKTIPADEVLELTDKKDQIFSRFILGVSPYTTSTATKKAVTSFSVPLAAVFYVWRCILSKPQFFPWPLFLATTI